MLIIASHSPLNNSATVRDRDICSKRPLVGNGLWGIEPNGNVIDNVTTLKGQGHDHNMLSVQYLDNRWRCL